MSFYQQLDEALKLRVDQALVVIQMADPQELDTIIREIQAVLDHTSRRYSNDDRIVALALYERAITYIARAEAAKYEPGAAIH